jgi:hypothetical protein
MVICMRTGKFPLHLPSRYASLGLGVVVLASMFGTTGCMSRKLTGIFVEPSAGACLYPGFSVQFHAYGLYTEGGHATVTTDITDQATWFVDLPDLATVSSTGLVTTTGNGIGLTNVTAKAQGEFGVVQASAPLTIKTTCVSGAVKTPLLVLPGDQNLSSTGDTLQLVAVAHYAATPYSEDVTAKTRWESSNPQVANVNAAGLVTAVGEGDTVITATRALPNGSLITSTEKIHVGGGSSPQE